LKNTKYLHSLASLSPIIAAAASYGINMVAVGTLKSTIEYSQYLQLQSWSIYFGSISALCIVDLKLSPNSNLYKSFKLLGISIITIVMILLGSMTLSAIISSYNLFFVSIVGSFYAVFRSLLMVSLYTKIPRIPITMRIIRAFLLTIFSLLIIFVYKYEPYPLQFVICQGLAAAVPFIIYLPRIIKFSFVSLLNTISVIYKNDRIRLFRRNVSYTIGMIHTPLFYTLIAGVSAMEKYNIFIYLIGLLLPISFLINQVLAERIRLIFGLSNISELKQIIIQSVGYIYYVIILYRLLYLIIIIFGALSYFGIIHYGIGTTILIIIQMLFICISPLSNLIISKSGIENIDISINITITILLVIVWKLHLIALESTIIASIIICSKYLLQQSIAYYKFDKYEV